ncbi:SsrA-binding protein SmpB [Pleionea mediterranea]|jgi:SsrA-binding protein|uniref:SsrA-binding protein n=1 Tax=Pleionea mediterranea TaxID=523701 RepID=A0A316FT98_9GAMM|nr:SsrA-binding protein SmpB [Pleionea mediterranea]PWK51924.1 SsrA-binding protein [Pleionea mediterranea]
MAKKKKVPGNVIAQNKKARHDYFIEDTLEAGLVLEGWEVKSLRDGKANLTEGYIFLKDGEAWLLSCHISPLQTASTHINPNPIRYRKLLLHNRELGKIFGAQQKEGYTIVALKLYWKNNKVKLEIGLAKGKKLHDKRATQKEREWNRTKQRVLKHS